MLSFPGFASFRVVDSQKLAAVSSMRHSVAIGNQINDHFVLDLDGKEEGDSSSETSMKLDISELPMLPNRGGLTSPVPLPRKRGSKQSYDSAGSGGGADDESSSVSSGQTDSGAPMSPIPGEVDDLHVAFEQKI